MTHNPYRYAAWSASTDTTEIPSYRRSIPLAEQPTHEISPLLLLPPLTAPRPRRFRRLLAYLGVTGLIAGLLLAEVALHTLTPVTGGIQ